jgi:hypothetical protein
MDKRMNKEENNKPVFTLSEADLTNPKLRRGYPGRKYRVYPKSWDEDAPVPHSNYKELLSSVYKAGRIVSIRDELMLALNATLPPPKPKKVEEETN